MEWKDSQTKEIVTRSVGITGGDVRKLLAILIMLSSGPSLPSENKSMKEIESTSMRWSKANQPIAEDEENHAEISPCAASGCPSLRLLINYVGQSKQTKWVALRNHLNTTFVFLSFASCVKSIAMLHLTLLSCSSPPLPYLYIRQSASKRKKAPQFLS